MPAPAFGSSSPSGSLSNLLSLWGHNIKTPACLQGSDFWLNVNRFSAPCGADPRPCDARDACVAADAAAGLRLSTRTITSYLFLHKYLHDNITMSQGKACVLRHGLSCQHQHILNTHSRPDAMHVPPLTTSLPPCFVFRCWVATTNLLLQVFRERAHRAGLGAAHGD